MGPAGDGSADPRARHGSTGQNRARRLPAASAILPVCGQRTACSAGPPPWLTALHGPPPPPPQLTRVLVGRLPCPVHGVEQGGHQPVVGLLVGADQVGEGSETFGLDALDGLGRQRRGSTVTSPPWLRWLRVLGQQLPVGCGPACCVEWGLFPKTVPMVNWKCSPRGELTPVSLAGQQSKRRRVQTSASCGRQGCSLGMLFSEGKKGRLQRAGYQEKP